MLEALLRQIYNNKQVIKYIISGSTAAFVDLILLFFFTDILKIWYLYSTTLAFIVAFFVSFYLQKFWTFRDGNKKIYKQMSMYLFVGGVNMLLNAGGMYLLVDWFGIIYILAQVIAGSLIGINSFLVYRFIIFRKKVKRIKKEKLISEKLKGLRILIATGIYPPDIGGPATYAKNLREELEKLGCEVRVVTYGEVENFKNENFKRFVISRNQNILFRYFKYFWKIYRMLEWVDIFYTLDLTSAGLPVSIVAKLKHKKVIFRTGGDFLWEKAIQKGWTDLPLVDYYKARKNLREKFLLHFSRKILKKFSLVFFSTELQKNIYRDYYNLNNKRTRLVPNAIPQINVTDVDNSYNNSVVFAGRFVKLKNIERLIRVFSEIKNNNFTLYIFGKGPQKNKLEKEIKSLGQEDRIKIKDSVDHDSLVKIISGSKFVILPSITEISPNLALECLSMGKPIILTKYSGFSQEIINNFITVDPESNNDIKEKIEYLLNQNNLDAYANRLKNISVKKREWSDVAIDHLNIFKELIKDE